MVSVVFNNKNVPKEYKQLFKKKGIGKKAKIFTLQEADQAIRDACGELSNRDTLSLTFQLNWEENGELHEALFEDVKIDSSDVEFGLKGVIERDLSNETSEEAYAVRDLLDASFASEPEKIDLQDDEEVDADDLEETLNIPTKPAEDSDNQESEQHGLTIEVPSAGLLAESLASPESTDDGVPDINKPLDSVFASLSVMNGLNSGSVNKQDTKDSSNVDEQPVRANVSVIDLSDYVDHENFNKVIKNVSTEPFKVERLHNQLGFIENPKDKYDEDLNKFINEKINSFGVNEAENKFNLEIQKIQSKALDEMTAFYRQSNETPLFDEIEENISDLVQGVENNFDDKISRNAVDMSERVARKKESIDSDIADKVEIYRQKLVSEGDDELKKYQLDLDREAKETEQNLLAKKDLEITRARNDAEKDIVTTRNKDLLSQRNDYLSEFSNRVNEVYLKTSEEILEQSKKLQSLILEKKNELQKQRKQDEQEALVNAREERKLAQKDRELEILENQKNETPKQVAKEVMSEITPLLTANLVGQAQSNSTVNSDELVELRQQVQEMRSVLEVNEVKKALEAERYKHQKDVKHGKHLTVVASVATLVLSASLFGGYMYLFDGNCTSKATVETVKSIEKGTNEATKSSVSNSKNDNTTDSSYDSPKEDNEFVRDKLTSDFAAAKNEIDRSAVLNAALGKGDLESLVSINNYWNTPLGSLYEAILRREGYNTRVRYLGLNADQRKYLSDGARSSIALAFYDVYDWQNGWAVRYEK